MQDHECGRAYGVVSEWAVRATEVSKFLLRHQPSIVHISAHGSSTGEILFQDEQGEAAAVPVKVLAELFSIVGSRTECVVLNACYSGEYARALAQHVGCVVGMERTIDDVSAMHFAGGFYRGLAFGRDYESAFRFGCNEIDLASLPDSWVPHFTTRFGDKVGAPPPRAGESERD